jgi:predicted MFS family arabinose efflux permease
MRAKYFGRRSGAVHGVLLVAFGLGGLLLQSGADADRLFVRYQWMFVAAAVARAGSAALLAVQPDPAGQVGASAVLPRARLRLALSEGQWRAPLYLASLMFGAYVAVPFFTPYMLEELALGYGAYAALTASSILTKALAFALCHALAVRFGQRALMVGSGILVALVPLAWVVARSHLALGAAEMLSGVAWAGLEYASFQVLLASAPDRARTEFLALAGAASGLAQLAGGMVGSALLERGLMGYADVFALSAVLRARALLVLVWGLWRHVQPKRLFRFALRIISVRPAGGTLGRPVVPSVPPPDPD